jgi:membrane protease YdiL (CAAX protease family)
VADALAAAGLAPPLQADAITTEEAGANATHSLIDAGAGWQTVLARLVGYCGAGLYEEVLFRLLMLPIAVWAFERLGCSTIAAGLWAILLSSLLFSAAHYIGPLGDSFAVYSFTFRAVAGLFFAILFLLRGFGITAGTHFFYDLLVGLL